jgi:polysaccharide pyruvyl transferase WcaK-like protein
MIGEQTGELVTARTLDVAPNLRSLYRYLIENEFIHEITDYNAAYLRIHPPETLAKLQSGDPGWEATVPAEVTRMIKERQFFGYRAAAAN